MRGLIGLLALACLATAPAVAAQPAETLSVVVRVSGRFVSSEGEDIGFDAELLGRFAAWNRLEES